MPQLNFPIAEPLLTAGAAGQEALRTEKDLAWLLYNHGPKVKGALLLRFRNALTADDADELLSQALAKAWEHRENFDPAKGSLRAWFFCIAQRAALDRLKRNWNKARSQEISWEALGAEPRAPEIEPEPEDEASAPQEALRERLREAMASLPPTQQRILWADALGAAASGITSEELGRELGLPAGTVRVYRKRAMTTLRRLLGAADPSIPA
jgi:RNA polymerase sigma factor (sigma-70 family)